jgi:hypothetical protein
MILMSRFDLKPKVYLLRKSGKSINEIAKIMSISKSTASIWCSEIKLTDNQKKIIQNKMRKMGKEGSLKGAQANRDKKIKSQIEARDWARAILKDISLRDKFISGISLYWAEGSKASSTTGFIFVNSDPKMIKFMFEWLVHSMKIPKNDIVAKVSINELHRYRINKVLNFWSNLLDLPVNQFLGTYFQKTIQSKVYHNHDVHYGVLRLSVKRSSKLKYRVLSLIEELKAGVAQVVRASHS